MRGLCGVYEMSIATPSQDTGIAITLAPRRRSNFVQTQNVETITLRALAYLNAGFSVHFRGPAGTGKTTLALEVAALLNRPTVMITGDEDMATATLVGSQRGKPLSQGGRPLHSQRNEDRRDRRAPLGRSPADHGLPRGIHPDL